MAIFVPQLLILGIVLISTLVLPMLLQDITDRADRWGDNGKVDRIDPFVEVYDVSYFFGDVCCVGVGAEYFSSSSF